METLNLQSSKLSISTIPQSEKSAILIERECSRLRKLGYKVVLTWKSQKRPLGKTWDESLKMPCDGFVNNIGLICTDNIIAIDIDKTSPNDKNCELIFKTLCKNFPELEKTSCTLTPSGGYHLYVKSAAKVESINRTDSWKFMYNGNTFRVPIDIKADGGFVVLAPSTYPGGVGAATNHWKEAFKGVPYKALVPIGEQTQEASNKLLNFLLNRKSFSISMTNDIEPFDSDARKFKSDSEQEDNAGSNEDESTDESW